MTIPRGKRARPSHATPLPSALEARFQRVYEENHLLIFRSVYSRLGNREDAEDLTTAIFLKAAASIDYGRAPNIIRQWLFRIMQTTLIDHWRARSRVIVYSLEELLAADEREAAGEEPGLRHITGDDELQRLFRSRLAVDRWPEALLDEGDEDKEQPAKALPAAGGERAAERVKRLLQALPARYRDVLTCRFLLNLTICDTALRLALSEANVKVMQSRALKRAAELESLGSDD